MKKTGYFPSGLHSSSWKTRAQALESLSITSKDKDHLFSILFASLYDQEPTVRMIAVHFLDKKIPNEMVINHLRKLFSEEEKQIRFSAVIASEALSKEYLLPLLKQLNESDPEIGLRIKQLTEELRD
ncbi:MAG: HEAT repeat domain-containing protein [Candidatus Hodarchaeales archaeon]|jgi:HEAT repeat protein